MRKDMSAVLVECYRLGPRSGYPRVRASNLSLEDLEELPTKESMRSPYSRGGDRKALNDNIAPLVRFVRSSIGRKWDDVYSEICENLKTNSTTQDHVRGHVFDIVETGVYLKNGELHLDGRPFDKKTWGWPVAYVDPADGVLKKLEDRPKWRRRPNSYFFGLDKRVRESFKETVDPVEVTPDFKFVKHRDVWYELNLVEKSSFVFGTDLCRKVLKIDDRWERPEVVDGKYLRRGRQLNKGDIRKNNLK